jgi:putative copper export protein
VHALFATVWTGGHVVLDLGVLPRALRAQSAAQIRGFEEVFEPLGLTALAIQVLTGLGMGWMYLPGFQGLFNPANPIGMLVGVKLLRLMIPHLTDDNLSGLAWHIRGITALAIAFVVVGALIRLGGLRQPRLHEVDEGTRTSRQAGAVEIKLTHIRESPSRD